MPSPQDEWLGSMTDAATKRHYGPDVLVHDAGTLFSFCPLSPRARAWIDDHVQGEVQWFGHALIVECRYAWALAKGNDRRLDGAVMNFLAHHEQAGAL